MYILSIESSTNNFAIAVSRDQKVLRARTLKSAKLLEDAINGAIAGIIKDCGLTFKKIDAFAVGLGPGSFTSLRVGLSTIKAFCLVTNKPVVGIGSLHVIAHSVKDMDGDEICVICDARRNMFYSARFTKTEQGLVLQGQYQLSDLQTILDQVSGKTVFVGDGLALCAKEIKLAYKACAAKCKAVFADEKYWYPQGKYLAHMASQRLSAGEQDDPVTIEPYYLYASDCQVTKNQ